MNDKFESEILKMLEEQEEYKNSFKDINIVNKDEAFSFLKKQTTLEALYYAYTYSLTDELKSDDDIYNYLKEKFIFNMDSLFRNYSRSFVHEYGESCGRTNDKAKINSALNKIKNFISEGNLYYAYWMFYSLCWSTKIDFSTYLEIYKLFEKETNIQGYLLRQYLDISKEDAANYQMIRLLEASSDKCIKENWRMAVGRRFIPDILYYYLLRKGVDKKELYQVEKSYIDFEKMKSEEKDRSSKCLKEKNVGWKNKN